MTRIRAGLACIPRNAISALASKFPRMNGLLATGGLVHSWIRASAGAYPARLAISPRVFAIAFARIRAGRHAGFLLESLSIPWITRVIDGTTRPLDTRGFAGY